MKLIIMSRLGTVKFVAPLFLPRHPHAFSTAVHIEDLFDEHPSRLPSFHHHHLLLLLLQKNDLHLHPSLAFELVAAEEPYKSGGQAWSALGTHEFVGEIRNTFFWCLEWW